MFTVVSIRKIMDPNSQNKTSNNTNEPPNQPASDNTAVQPVAERSNPVQMPQQSTTSETAAPANQAPTDAANSPIENMSQNGGTSVEPNSASVVNSQNTPTTAPASKKSKKPLVITLVAIVLLAAAGGGVYAYMKNKSTKNEKTNTATVQVDKKTTVTTNTTGRTIPGYVALDKLCYTIQVPKDNDAGSENSCLFSARFGADKTASMNMTYFTKNNEGIDANIAALKENETKTGNTLVSEESVKIGGIDSKKLVFKVNGATPSETAHYLIPTTKYQVQGVPITGFELISPLYDRPANKTIIDNIVSSIQWK